MTHITKHTPWPIDIPIPCSVCGTRGWILVRNDTHGLRIERCDECTIMNDSQAWDMAESFLTDLLMRFDEGTNLEKAAAAPAMYEALKMARWLSNECECHESWNAPEGNLCGHCTAALAIKTALSQAEGRQA